ncbi:hypothetical protein BD413DRAFT_611911 [Trametes elegans]|nr:hypothetical protein BD413DRAFT_611911 [Trametes elegans]
MSGDSQYEQEIVADYPRLLVENYCIVASSALLWFDFVLTLPTEYRRIWQRKYTGATLVYLLMRYIAVIERIFFVAEVLLWKSSDGPLLCAGRCERALMRKYRCARISRTDDVLLSMNYLAFSAFTALRVYGVWGRDWKPLLIVLPLSLVKPALLIYESSNYVAIQQGPPYGCLYIWLLPDNVLSKWVFLLTGVQPVLWLNSGRVVSIATKAATIAADSILIALTWIKTFAIQRDSHKAKMRTPLATLLLRDGEWTAYFLILLVIQIITIISNQIGNKLTIWLVWPYFDQVYVPNVPSLPTQFTVIFLSRFMLDLRGLYFAGARDPAADGDAQTTLRWSDVRFQGFSRFSSAAVGNLGATLGTHSQPKPASPGAPGGAGGGARDERDSSDSEYTQAGEYVCEDEDEDEEGGGDGDGASVQYCDDPFRVGMKGAGGAAPWRRRAPGLGADVESGGAVDVEKGPGDTPGQPRMVAQGIASETDDRQEEMRSGQAA